MAERVKDMKYASVKEREALAKQLIAEIDTMETVPTTSKPNKIPAEVEEAVELME